MDIFKLGDKILDLLNVIFAFWNNQVSLVFALLGQSPTAFKDGKPWDVIEGLEPVFGTICRNQTSAAAAGTAQSPPCGI